jgi:hypothetical protein
VARFARFSDVLALDAEALRALFLGSDDAPERLWAAWALAMHHGDGAAAVLHEGAAREPTPGVRAHLALMLVAHGEIDAAAAFARFDPDAMVRASACRHLARVAKPTDALLCTLLAERLATDESNEVKMAIVDGMRDDAPPALVEHCNTLLSAGDEEVRRAAIDSILRRTAASTPLPPELRAHARTEPSSELRATLVDAWCEREGALTAVREMCTWETQHVIVALDEAIARDIPIGSAELEPLLARKEAPIRVVLAELAEAGRFEPPLSWLGDVVLTAIDSTSLATEAGWAAATSAMRVLADRLERTEHASLSASELRLVARLRAAFEREVEQAVPEAALARREEIEWEDEVSELVFLGMKLLPLLVRLDVPMN